MAARGCLARLVAAVVVAWCASALAAPIHVVIDTDIGQNFDDSWALAFALGSPEQFRVHMVLTAAHNTVGRAQIAAKYLTVYNRTDVAVGVGVYQDPLVGPLYSWASSFSLASYAGTVHHDGVRALAELVTELAPEPLFVLAIAPFVNFGSLVARFPREAAQLGGIVAMAGSIDVCYNATAGSCPEYNVADDVAASDVLFTRAWPLTITPLDTCGNAMAPTVWSWLAAHNTSAFPTVQIVLETYCWWTGYAVCAPGSAKPFCCQTQSDVLWDPTAVFLGYNRSAFGMVNLPIVITPNGTTAVEQGGKIVDVALTWQSGGLERFFLALASAVIRGASL